MDREQAGNALNIIWNVNHHLTLTGGQSWQISPVDLGLFLDPTATSLGAYRAGRASLWAELEQILRQPSHVISPVIAFRTDLARAELDRLARTLDVAPQEAALTFANAKWSAIPGKAGLVMRPVAPQTADLAPVAAKLQASVNKPLKIQVYDPIQDETFDWTVPPETLATWLVVDHPAALNPKITLDPKRLPAYLDGKQAALAPLRTLQPYQLPADPTQFWLQGQILYLITRNLPTTYPVVVGDTLYLIARKVEVPYWMILKANPGVTDASLRKGQSLNIPSKSDSLPLPVVMGKRIVVSISKQRMWTYENGKLRKEYVISTGMSDSPTMPGVYQIQSHIENAYASNWDLWMPNFMGIYEAVPGFWNGIHGLPIMSNGLRLWGNVLGSPITYGCILMDLKDGQELYNWSQEGVVVEINS
jgi:LysM repeat protein